MNTVPYRTERVPARSHPPIGKMAIFVTPGERLVVAGHFRQGRRGHLARRGLETLQESDGLRRDILIPLLFTQPADRRSWRVLKPNEFFSPAQFGARLIPYVTFDIGFSGACMLLLIIYLYDTIRDAASLTPSGSGDLMAPVTIDDGGVYATCHRGCYVLICLQLHTLRSTGRRFPQLTGSWF